MFQVNEDECNGCGVCLGCCPVGAVVIELQVAKIDEASCTSCGACSDECPQQAIYEYEELPAVYERERETAVSSASRLPVASKRGQVSLTRQEKVAAVTVLTPVLARLLLRFASHITLGGRGGNRSLSSGDSGRRQPLGKTNQGRYRWRGGS